MLFKAWGLQMDPGKVIADVVFGSGGGAALHADRALAHRTAFSRDDIVTGQIETLLMRSAALRGQATRKSEGHAVLVQSSPNSMLVDSLNATKSGDEATRAFKPSGNAMPLALRLTGKFKTAFPKGLKPEPASKKNHPPPERLPCASRPRELGHRGGGRRHARRRRRGRRAGRLGQQSGRALNGNLAFALGMVEQFAAATT